MKTPYLFGFLAAALCHTVVLFGFHWQSIAHPLAMEDRLEGVEIGLIDVSPEVTQISTLSAPPAPTPISIPEPTPESPPNPTPIPEPTLESTPAIMPANEMVLPATTLTLSAVPDKHPEQPKPMPQPVVEKKPLKRRATNQAIPARTRVSTQASTGAEARAGNPNGTGNSYPTYRSNPKPEYPVEARRNRQEGVVIISVQIKSDGHPSDVTVKQSSGFPLLDRAAVDSVGRWLFEPAHSGGLPIASHVDVPIRFSLEGR